MSEEKLEDVEYIGGAPYAHQLTAGLHSLNDSDRQHDGPLTIEDEIETKRIMRKLDWRVLPICSVLYLFSFLDRTAIGNAKVAGMNVELGITATEYALALSLFFVTYGLLEVPSNLMLKKYGAKLWLPFIVFWWGVVMTLTGVVQNAGGLIAARIMLGAAEAGLFPGVSLLLSFLYPRAYISLRIGTFFSAATVAGAFGGLLAYGLSHVNAGSYSGWRWLFIVEGLLTVGVAIISYFLLFSNVDGAKFLTDKEKHYIKDRLTYDGTDVPMNDEFAWKFVIAGLIDWKTWVSLITYIGTVTPLYSIALTLPSILKTTLGYDAIQSQILTIPVYCVAAINVLLFSYFSDRTKNRAYFICLGTGVSAIGWIMGFASRNPKVRYAACFIGALGSYAGFPPLIALLSQNVGGKSKRSVTLAIQVGIGGMCGIISSNIFLPQEAPNYPTAYIINIACNIVAFWGALGLIFMLRLANARKQRMVDSGEAAKLTRKQLADLGDSSPYFKYRW
ncbi:MFS general substrate transporter [Tilletiaria anomala UBC 951]|uniref:MFS general substrate transporter n=1 Tax=Tilletiaria anomala (strain ATCC 24038 / CBS 436.72 / UBC 951) TaxID=1037660 RepID=A0A066VT18_TILAU|nr:MFS general substrate transporter [Tilletiaria anomala UBC 951]KDN41954.1 MFS general substrate transporter [Tilletiaria anomala UBC 951]